MGAMDDESYAGKVYDQIMIVLRGRKAATNFSYTKEDVQDILEGDILTESRKMIEDICESK